MSFLAALCAVKPVDNIIFSIYIFFLIFEYVQILLNIVKNVKPNTALIKPQS